MQGTSALPAAEQAVALTRNRYGEEHTAFASAIAWLAYIYRAQGRHAAAASSYTRSLGIYEKVLGPEDPNVGNLLNNLAELYQAQGRYGEAEPLYKRSLAIREKVLGSEHPAVGSLLSNLGELYRSQGRYGEAEALHRRSLTITEKALGPDHRDVGTSLNNLALVYANQDRYDEAEPLYKRSIGIYEKALGPEHPYVTQSLNNLAKTYETQRRYSEAERLYKRSRGIREKALGPNHPDVGTSLNDLAGLYRRQGRLAEAEPLYKRSIGILEKALGPDHRDVGASLNNLALLYGSQGRPADAEPLHKRSLRIAEKALGPEHPDVGTTLGNLAALAHIQSDWAGAAAYWRRSTGVIKRRAERGLAAGRGEAFGGEAQSSRLEFWGLVKATHRLAGQGHNATLAAEMFETAQWVQGSEAAASLAQMAARSAKGSPQLAGLVRERQDLVGEWQAKDKLLIAAKSEAPGKRKADTEKELVERLDAIDSRLTAIDQRFVRDFPDYAALVSPAPISVREVQAQLAADEALVLFLNTPEWKPLPEETFVWVVTKSDVRWTRSEFGTAALTREIAALRCGLDGTAWYGEGAKKCTHALSLPPAKIPAPDQPLPFDHDRAHKLYLALFGEVQDLIKGKHLLVVPSGPLTQLPFQVLLTQPLSSGGHRAAAWLARQHAITVLPAVSSLKALRSVGRPSAALRPMIGNPLLNGPDERYAGYAKLAREKQRCSESRQQERVARVSNRNVVAHVETRGGLADLSSIKRQLPLPETADELCAVARDVKAEVGDIRLGAQATEREVKRLSASGYLAQFRVVHFATHGFLSGQLDGAHEPGLILTPPDLATEEDDGYLSASEIAALKLDADWVILSACNTAAGAATSAEALSGLARAFIYAQARALLVSHWEVYSHATVKLIVVAVREMARDPKVGRAEALRRSMLALVDKGEPHEAHPSYWAPFVVVGEGAAAR